MVDQAYNYGNGIQHYYYLQQSPSPSNVMTGASGAIAAMATSSGCGAVYASGSGHVLAGLPKIQVEAIRRVAGELALSKNFEFDHSKLCHGVDVNTSGATPWDFNRCDMGQFGDAGYQLCWGKWAISDVLGLKLRPSGDANNGVFMREGKCSNNIDLTEALCQTNGGTWNFAYCSDRSITTKAACTAPATWYAPCSVDGYLTQASCQANFGIWDSYFVKSTVNQWDLNFFESCALVDSSVKTALDAYNAAANANPSTLAQSHHDALLRSCRDALMASGTRLGKLDTEVALARNLAMRWEWMPTKAIACSGSNQTRDKVLNGLAASCMADASLNMFCDFSGNCMSSLRCNGSKEGGKCFKDGEFIGNIPGRMGFMDLKLRSGGAFELNELVQDRWNQWNFTKNKNETCESTRNMLVNSQKKADTEFVGVLKTTEKMECVVDTTAGTTTAAPGAAGTAGGNAGNSAQATNFDRAKMGDTLQKLRFRKCANLTCSEYP
jgi:hypothetical protein